MNFAGLPAPANCEISNLQQEGSSLWDSVNAREGEAAIPVRPDAYFILKHNERPEGKNKFHVFPGSRSVDHGAQPNGHEACRLCCLLRAAAAYAKVPGMRSFLAVTVTPSGAGPTSSGKVSIRSPRTRLAEHIASSRSKISRSPRFCRRPPARDSPRRNGAV